MTNVGEGVRVLYGDDGDVLLTDVDVSILYFDSTFTGEVGDFLGNDKYFGVNAFTTLDGLCSEFFASTSTLSFAGGNENSYYAWTWNNGENTKENYYGRFYLNKAMKLTSTGEEYAVIGQSVTSSAGVGFYLLGDGSEEDVQYAIDANAKIKTWEIVVETGAELTVSGDVVIGYYDEGNQQKHQKGGLNMKAGSKMTIADGAKVALDGALLNSGTLVVNEDFAIRQTMGSGATTLTRGEASIEVNGTKFSYTGFNKDGATDNIALIAAQYNPWASSEKITDEETESTVILNNGTEFVVDNATLHIGKNGALCVNASSVDADIVTNNGTINVTGESELTIGALTGKISLQEGAALKDSSITGDKTASIYSYGDVTVKNSTLRITDENYGQNALRVSEGTATLSGTNSISGLATDHEDGNNGELKIIVADGTTMVGSEGGYKKAESGNGFDIAGDAVIGNIIVRNGGDLEVVNEATLNLIGQLSNRGTVTVRGNMLITGIQGAGNVGLAGSGDVDESGSMIIDGGKLTDKQSEYVSANDLHAVINMTIGHSASTGVSEARSG